MDEFEANMDTRKAIKEKLRQNFDGKIVHNDLTKKIKERANVPTYVLEFLLGQYCSTDDDEIVQKGVETVKRILADNYVRPDESEMCWVSGWPMPTRWPTGRISPPSPWAAGSSSPVISSWRGSMNRRPKRRKYFSGYFKDSVVFVCVAISARRRNACEQPSGARRLASRKGG